MLKSSGPVPTQDMQTPPHLSFLFPSFYLYSYRKNSSKIGSSVYKNQYYVMNYFINSFTGASEVNLLVQDNEVQETKHFGDMVHGTKSVFFLPN